MSTSAPTTVSRIWVNDADSGLGTRVLGRIATYDRFVYGESGACDVVIHLGPGDHDTRARRGESLTEGTSTLLAGASRSGARHLVLVSSAMVYGAWANNPVPLTEDAVLRPVVAMASDGTSGLARALAAGMGQRFGEDDPPAQFLHLDDLASAVALAADLRLDGVYNVAPDGSIPADSVRALAGARPRLKLPERVAEVIGRLRWQFQRGPIPPGLRSYTRSPWLVANDRLKAVGWQPTVTNEQAYVEGTEAKWWTMITPKRRQELAFTGVGTLIAMAAGLIALLVRRRRKRSQS
jgi:nucleoside-diphosphate-sugar epimerase